MKVLSIRGANLTSFAGDFALELDRPPLDRLGLFAITGATGAGKSTLLDAMCLALFDRTPRLGGRGGVPVGRADEEEEARLSAYDVRGMLRRGAGEGFAEVDFLGKDGKRYRARWSVWRARSRAEGRFRPQEMSLTEVASGQQFGRTKGEVLTAIQERLGLSFDQFRRSALLAQGEFAAFLKADASERAELLERMTGTEIYSRLSIAAHEKNKAEQEELTRRETGLKAIALLSEEERGAVAVQLGAESEARQAAEARLAEAEAAAAWHAEGATLASARVEAQSREALAARELEAARPRVKRLEEVRAAESYRGQVAAAGALERQWVEARSALEARAAEVEAARARASSRKTLLAEAEAARAAALAEEEAARPALEEAAGLDARLGAATKEAEEARGRARASSEAAAKARAELDQVVAREEAARVMGEGARTWLSEKAHWAALADEWPRWQRELERYEKALGEARGAREAGAELRARADSLRDATRLRRRERDAAAEAEALAQAAATHADAALGEGSGAGRRALRESLHARQEVLQELKEARRELLARAVEAADAEREGSAARAEAEDAERASSEAAGQRLEHEVTLKEARRALAQAQATQGFASQRAQLREGEACPLCGATSHPYRHEVSALEDLVARSSARVEALESERAESARREVEASTRRAAARARQTQAEERRDAATARAADHRAAWGKARERWRSTAALAGAAREEAAPPEGGDSPEAGAWLEAMAGEVLARLASVKAEEEAAEGLARASREARAALEAQRTRREVAGEALRRAEEDLARAEGALKEGLARLEAADATLRQVLADVSPVFANDAGWEAKLEANPEDFRQKCGKRVTMWREREDVVQKAKAREEEEQRHRARIQGQLDVNARRAEDEAALAALKEQARGELARARAGLLGGRPTDEVRAGLRERLALATRAFEQAREAAEAGRQAEEVARARAVDAERALAAAQGARDAAWAELSSRLAARGTTLDAVEALLAHDAAWCDAEERALAALREALAQARAVLAERREREAAHTASGAPALSEPEALEARGRLRGDVEARRSAEARLRARLEADDAARARHGSEAEALAERRRAGEVWKALGELIGSHDGKRFKVFAQSLTLDALLLHANAHLQELARRYRLMRVPGHDLDLQVVDGDMGDEVRGVASLSGGESFLVSLALALGLASLSSETTQVETLFIDEGFGTLDPETLEVALATLDALQATGRQVGIISHVSGLAERIGVQVRVVKQGGGRSRLVVEGDLGLSLLVGQQVVA
ncbi:AAA family ATPase [Myxococcus stipitatus]|uniref:AAA family ATPase n=1 Tax=Myxococcus stipitatus TaxID=83455 RepID=UPI001F1EEFBD|nr:AAA family ATPase [Myxococcus stipitatus]MCE9672276.1 AAA family ATPase [Myxococcus stipitatus]